MTLDLDERQRAMLQEMHLRVWWPLSAGRQPASQVSTTPTRPAAPDAPARQVRVQPAEPMPSHDQAPASTRTAGTSVGNLSALAAAIASCDACGLCEGRKATVFSAPALARQADWMVVGEPPTEEEERTGIPFAGPEGELLDNMLRAVQCSRDGSGASGAWLTKVVKCRPAVARNPLPQELALCARYLRDEVALVRPRVILAMGRFAALSLLSEGDADFAKLPFARLRGRLHRFAGVPVVVTNSPARLLRAPQEKAGAWADLCLAQSAARGASSAAVAGP